MVIAVVVSTASSRWANAQTAECRWPAISPLNGPRSAVGASVERASGGAAGHPPRRLERATPPDGRTTSGAKREQEIYHVGLLHFLARKDPAQSFPLIDEKRLTASFFKNEECRPAADAVEMHVQRDSAVPAHLTALDPQPRQPRQPDGIAVRRAHRRPWFHSAVVCDAPVLLADPRHVESRGVPPDRRRAARPQDAQRLRSALREAPDGTRRPWPHPARQRSRQHLVPMRRSTPIHWAGPAVDREEPIRPVAFSGQGGAPAHAAQLPRVSPLVHSRALPAGRLRPPAPKIDGCSGNLSKPCHPSSGCCPFLPTVTTVLMEISQGNPMEGSVMPLPEPQAAPFSAATASLIAPPGP